ncbi:iron complex transport system permease protein [Desulfofundulus australicus DSM 11792]|uniref:Iron complex transport system permease protein n=1 Tax=Desulfofundulus australicus DSM 11792 TaxID=1121425 RepID=A0A1M5A8W5_9FIRM|nr:iron ABC transporter permease [Desulfofundulus australicus]SHF26791.1 iron complex transport system permease protein [Desulfofundulus australicus DSM 11792]
MGLPVEVGGPGPGADISAIKTAYSRHIGRKILLVGVLLGLTGATALVATAVGAAGISVADVWRVILSHLGVPVILENDLAETVVWEIRLPRILLATITGMSLAGAGAVMQGVLRNPLVSPYTMGLSSGAAFGAALAIVLGTGLVGGNYLDVSRWLIVTNAFIFGGLTTLLAFSLARFKGMAPETLVLGGVAVGYLFQAGVSLLKYISNNEALKELVVWLMGGFWGADWQTVMLLTPVVLFCMAGLLLYAWDLNVLGAGEEVAASLGIKVGRLRVYTLTLATLAAAATVAFTGIIGFVCLVGPHICRMLVGSDNRFLIPCSCLMGAVLLLLADTLARTIIAPAEIPVGIITALMGSPFFIYLLIKKKRQWWG